MTAELNHIGLRNQIDQASDHHGYLDKYEEMLAEHRVRRMVLIVGNRHIAIANTFAEFLPDAEIAALTYAPVSDDDRTRVRSNVSLFQVRDLITIHRALATVGPIDVLIEDSPNRKSQKREIFRCFFPALRDGGLYVAEDLHASYIPSLIDDSKEDLWQMVTRLLSLKASAGRVPASASSDDLSLADSINSVEFDGKLLAVRKKGTSAVKLRHGESNTILQDKYGDTWGRVIATLPSKEIRSEALVSANDFAIGRKKLPQSFHVPEIYVREYLDVVAFPRQVLMKDEILLPDTFRLGRTSRLNNTALRPLSHYFSQMPTSNSKAVRLPGQYYYLDLEYNRHFGHFLTEAIPRLYAWDKAKTENPSIKILMSVSSDSGSLQPYQAEILQAHGIGLDDIHVLTSPVRVDSLVSAMPLFHNGNYVHPNIRSTYERIAKNLVDADSPAGERIFVSRKPGMWRECINMEALEELFVKYGFEVIYPEDYSLAEQATIFAHAKSVGGYIGSSLYSAMFSAEPIDIIGFVNTAYRSTNEYFIATALGHRMHMFWCDDVKDNRRFDSSNRPLAPTNYDFKFDFGRDGQALIQVLESLS